MFASVVPPEEFAMNLRTFRMTETEHFHSSYFAKRRRSEIGVTDSDRAETFCENFPLVGGETRAAG